MNIDILTSLPDSLKSLILDGYVILYRVKNKDSKYYQSYVVFMNIFYIIDEFGKCYEISKSFDRSELEIITNIGSDKIKSSAIKINIDSNKLKGILND